MINNSELLTEYGDEALCMAAAANQLASVEMLLDNGVDVTNLKTYIDNLDAFAYAAINDNLDMLNLISDKGYSKDCAGAMHGACMFGSESALEYLLKKGIDPDIVYDLETPLFTAVSNGNTGCVEILIQNKADVNAVYKSSTLETTALVKACEEHDLECVKYLVEAGADVNFNVKISENETMSYPLYIAVETGYIEIVQYLVENGAKINDYLLEIAEESSDEIYEYLSDQTE